MAVVADYAALGTFSFASGDGDPVVAITVDVSIDASDPDGWVAAGNGQSPSITGSVFWIRFTIENRDSFGPISALDISGAEGTPLGANVCPNLAPIAASATEECIVGPLTAVIGSQSFGLSVTATDIRQMNQYGEFFDPPVRAPGYDGAATSFSLLFDPGMLIEGRASGSSVDVDVPGLKATVSVDCAGTPGDGSPLGVVAYSIATFDASGAPTTDGCEDVPWETVQYDATGDGEVNYTGT